MPYNPYPSAYSGLSTGVSSLGNTIADAIKKMEEKKKQEATMALLKSFISGQGNTPATDWTSNVSPGTTPGAGAAPTDWSSSVTQGVSQGYGGSGYGAPVDWSSNIAQGTGASAGGNKGSSAGGNKGG